MAYRTSDKPTVLITGAAMRIGRAIALDMAARGWAVALHYNRSGALAQEAASEITGRGGSAVALQAELADTERAEGLVEACAKALAPPCCLVNNASVFEHDTIGTLTQETWRAHLDVNLTAPVFLAQAFARTLPEEMSGDIVNILDQRVWKLTPDYFSYTISKAALWTATKTLAQALSPRIRVNAIGPGPTLANARQSEAVFAAQQRATPLGRGPALAEICAAIRFILDAPSMTGQMIALDGGQHLAWRTSDVDADGG